jgi:hypothetical protein
MILIIIDILAKYVRFLPERAHGTVVFQLSMIPQHPPPDAEPSASRRCEFGLVDVIQVGSLWHWRCNGGPWSKLTFTSEEDAYQGAAFSAGANNEAASSLAAGVGDGGRVATEPKVRFGLEAESSGEAP